jgi:hypothetical protein
MTITALATESEAVDEDVEAEEGPKTAEKKVWTGDEILADIGITIPQIDAYLKTQNKPAWATVAADKRLAFAQSLSKVPTTPVRKAFDAWREQMRTGEETPKVDEKVEPKVDDTPKVDAPKPEEKVEPKADPKPVETPKEEPKEEPKAETEGEKKAEHHKSFTAGERKWFMSQLTAMNLDYPDVADFCVAKSKLGTRPSAWTTAARAALVKKLQVDGKAEVEAWLAAREAAKPVEDGDSGDPARSGL